jgi:ribonuclease R
MQRKTKTSEIASGTIRIHKRGFGFVIPDERSRFPDDIFIPRHATRGAVDGDSVEVAVHPDPVAEKGPEGSVIKILKRGRSHLAGVVTYVGRKKNTFAYAPLLGEDQTILIKPTGEKELKVGDRIIIHILDWGGKGRECLGEMSAYIGHISDPSCDIAAAVEEFELNDSFSHQAIKEAKNYGQSVSLKELNGRKDLRSMVCFTIDPDTAKDFDDALSLTRDENGNYHLGVHIADVSHYVRPGTQLDKEAAERCNSVYFPGTVLPMLPHELSSHLCSLKPHLNRLAISVLVMLDPEGNLLNTHICRSLIRSQKRFTYKEAKEVLVGEQKSKFLPELKLMVELCYILKKRRCERGSIEFALPDISVQVNEAGGVEKIEVIEYDITHQLVEEFMLLANERVATYLNQQGKALTYRIHEEPNPDNMRDFAQTATAIGFELSNAPTNEELQEFFDKARETPFGQFLATAFIRSMKLATYSTQNVGHYGLGLEHYTHFTSPIRRYIDLMVHRTLFDEVEAEMDLEEIALRCSEKERLSAKAEASVVLLKKLRYLDELRQKGIHRFEGVIIALKPFGIFFELKDMMYEGFLPITDKKFSLGDKILVKLMEVDLVTRQTSWHLLQKEKGKFNIKKTKRRRAK